MENKKIASYFIPHGWWPWNLMWDRYIKESWHIGLKKYLNDLWKKYLDVDAIIVVSSHWEEEDISISFVDDYNLYYDYYGFPKNTYKVDYKVKWSPLIAEKVEKALNDFDIKTQRNYNRWLDHWVFIPLMEMYPDIKIPVIQVSISSNLDPKFHLKVWEALSKFRSENILILWSWMSYHNLRWFFSFEKSFTDESEDFHNFLTKSVEKDDIDSLLNISNTALLNSIHPRIEHLIPLYTIIWTWINDKKTLDSEVSIMNIKVASYKVE